jgi:hypothetical protein
MNQSTSRPTCQVFSTLVYDVLALKTFHNVLAFIHLRLAAPTQKMECAHIRRCQNWLANPRRMAPIYGSKFSPLDYL